MRAYGNVGGTPRFLASARGPYVTDVDGNEYVDLVGSWGPALLGHAHPEVVEAVREAAGRGLSFGAPTLTETDLVDEIRSRVPPAEKVRLVSTGTEATMTALRLARAFTGRDLVVKFAGCYHGHVDALLASAGSGVATLGLPDSAGVSAAVAGETLVVPYNDVEAVEAAFAEHGDRIAAVITEAAPANMGVVPPLPGFNAALRRLTLTHGALLIQDEVLTGFRVGYSGWWGLEGLREGWAADLHTFGKVIGGGLPGRRGRWAPGRHGAAGPRRAPSTRRAPCRGTRWRPRPAWRRCASRTRRSTPGSTPSPRSCAVSSPRRCRPRACRTPSSGRATCSARSSVPTPPRTAPGTTRPCWPRSRGATHRSSRRCSSPGVYAPPSPFEAWFVSAAHDDDAVDRIVSALPAAVRAAAQATAPTA